MLKAICPSVIQSETETRPELLHLTKLFGRNAPLQVDLGCGDGLFLSQFAQLRPERNFLGIDRLTGRVLKARRKSAHLENVRVLNVESAYAVRYLLPEVSVETFYLFFPDPWPKRRHHRRRIVTNDFLDSIHRALEPHGVLRIATDQDDYFEQIARIGRSDSRFTVIDVNELDLPRTKFEHRFVQAGAPIYRLALRKISPVT
jgi:tRNA (guanine-N7-)-methyltransferase